tara:strand:- start:589 stop:1110 length:522 start_codon:yes stop_codon:yes gene_type:complete
MAKDFLKSDPIADLEAQLNSDFNTVIRKAHKSLGTKTHSPVYTGFFASSWKVANTPPKAKDDILKFKPWSEIKRQSKGKRPSNPKVQPRFKVTKTFDIKKTVFIGNTVKYASYALEGGKIQNFVQGRMVQIIKDNMKEKKGKLFLLGAPNVDDKGTTGGFGNLAPGIGYGDVL